MSRKLDPKIIRIGDKVRITNPEMFVRCGYPMQKMDARVGVDQYQPYIIELLRYTIGGSSDWRIVNEMIEALAYGYMRVHNYGGNERQIYTDYEYGLLRLECTVTKIKFVKTGTYTPGYQISEGDFTPNHLSNEKTHKILLLKNNLGHVIGWIEAKNVDKVS